MRLQSHGRGTVDEPQQFAVDGLNQLRRKSTRIARAVQHFGQRLRLVGARDEERDGSPPG